MWRTHPQTQNYRINETGKEFQGHWVQTVTDPHCVNQTKALSAMSRHSLDTSKGWELQHLPSNVYQPLLGRNSPWCLTWTSSSAVWGSSFFSCQNGTVSGLWPHRWGAGTILTYFWQVRGPSCLELPQRASEPISHSLFVPTLSLITQKHLEESLQRGMGSRLGYAGENPETPLEVTWVLIFDWLWPLRKLILQDAEPFR